jgi:hypothetical protein
MIELKLRTKTPVVHSFGETWLGETLLAFWTEHALLSPSRLTLESNEKFLLPWLPENSYQEENGEGNATAVEHSLGVATSSHVGPSSLFPVERRKGRLADVRRNHRDIKEGPLKPTFRFRKQTNTSSSFEA